MSESVLDKLVKVLDANFGYVEEEKAEILARRIMGSGLIMEDKPYWIPLTEILPDKTGHYLAVVNGETHEVYYCHESHAWLDPVEEWADWTRFVTHWMPLPEPPKGE